jgi:hypothetical protein
MTTICVTRLSHTYSCYFQCTVVFIQAFLLSDVLFDPAAVEKRRRLATLEPFDEWEEVALKASHYFLLTATRGTVGQLLATAAEVKLGSSVVVG